MSSFNENLEGMLDKADGVVRDDLKFKARLDIGDDAYRWLSMAKNLSGFLGGTTAAGAAGWGGFVAANGAWMGGLSVLGKLGLAAGFVATPIWVVAAGAAAAGGVAGAYLGARRLLKKAEDEAYVKVPKFINTPLDVLASQLATLLAVPAVDMAAADGSVAECETSRLEEYFVNDWGYSPTYVHGVIKLQVETHSSFNFDGYIGHIREACNATKELRFAKVREEILGIMREIMVTDQETRSSEEAVLTKWEAAMSL